MASLLFPAVCLFAAAFSFGAENPASVVPAPIAVSPVESADIAALAPSNRERWQEPKGKWEFESDGLTGSGESRIDFRGPFKPPFTLEFRLKVLKGMRPRVYIGPFTFANKGYERTLAIYPNNGDGVPIPYEENREYAVSIAISRDGALLTIDGNKVMTATLPLEEEVSSLGFPAATGGQRG